MRVTFDGVSTFTVKGVTYLDFTSMIVVVEPNTHGIENIRFTVKAMIDIKVMA